MKNKIISLFLAVLFLFCFGVTVSAENTETTGLEEYYVVDDADLLSDAEEATLSETLKKISNTYNAQIVVGTIDVMEGTDIDTFIEFSYDQLELGYGENYDGVLLLVCMDPREYRILSNGFAADAISSDAIDSISDTIVNDLSNGDYISAFEQFAEECEYYLDGHINGFPFKFAKNLLISLAIGLVLALIVTGNMKSKLKSVRKQAAATEYTKPGSMQVTYSNDFFLYRVVDRQKKESKSSSSSGSSRNVGGGSF